MLTLVLVLVRLWLSGGGERACLRRGQASSLDVRLTEIYDEDLAPEVVCAVVLVLMLPLMLRGRCSAGTRRAATCSIATGPP